MSTPPKPDETIQLTVEVPLGGGMHRPLHGSLLDTETGAALDDAAHEAALRDSVLRTPR